MNNTTPPFRIEHHHPEMAAMFFDAADSWLMARSKALALSLRLIRARAGGTVVIIRQDTGEIVSTYSIPRFGP